MMQAKIVVWALLLGSLVACLCLPYLHWKTPEPRLFLLRAHLLFPVAIILAQAALAWTPRIPGRNFVPPAWNRRQWLAIAVLALLAAMLLWRFLDPQVGRLYPGLLPRGWRACLLTLPWTALFQPLLLVAGVYAFAVRLTRREPVATAAVVLVHGLLLAQLRAGLEPFWFAANLLGGMLFALFQATAYKWQGYPALAAIGLITGLRFLLRGW